MAKVRVAQRGEGQRNDVEISCGESTLIYISNGKEQRCVDALMVIRKG